MRRLDEGNIPCIPSYAAATDSNRTMKQVPGLRTRREAVVGRITVLPSQQKKAMEIAVERICNRLLLRDHAPLSFR